MLQKHIDTFNEVKEMIKIEANLAFINFIKPFHLYINASDIRLGATLVQDSKPLGFYTIKLKATQLNYMVGKNKPLGIVEGLKVFGSFIHGQDLTVNTEHLNLLYNKLPNQRVMRWRLLSEEHYLKIVHVTGVDNDAFSTLSC